MDFPKVSFPDRAAMQEYADKVCNCEAKECVICAAKKAMKRFEKYAESGNIEDMKKALGSWARFSRLVGDLDGLETD